MSTVEKLEEVDAHTLLGGLQNSSDSSENNSEIFYKVMYTFTIGPSNPTPSEMETYVHIKTCTQ